MPSKKSEIMGDGTKDMMGDGSKPGVGAGGDSSKADPMATLAADLASLRATVESRLPKKAAYNDLAQISGGQITPNAVVAR